MEFKCHQTDKSLIISIYCPAIRAVDVEIHVDESLVTVHVNPYFLRLNFSHSLLDDDASSAEYDPSSGHLTVTLTKAFPGEDFHDLDLLAKLLAPRPTTKPTVEIQVMSSDSVSDTDELVTKAEQLSLDNELLEAAQNDWQIQQTVDLSPLRLSAEIRYGFLNSYSGYFTNVAYTENEVNELGADAETCPPDERRRKRIEHENAKWDEEHYLADYVEDENILPLLAWRHPYLEVGHTGYSEREDLQTLNLPRKEYIPTPAETQGLYLTLISLLFSYAYESRTNLHDPTSESAWTICSLIPAFSALDPPPYAPGHGTTSKILDDDILHTLLSSYRRSLAFPLHRSFALANACVKDVAGFLGKGKRVVFKCLLEMKDVLDHHAVYYVYSKVWVNDFCLWVQAHSRDDVFLEISEQLRSMVIEKALIGWDIEGLEKLAHDIQSGHGDREGDSDDE